jgi:hypothetical protein
MLTGHSWLVISQLTNTYWYKDVGDMLPCDPMNTKSKNTGLIDRWKRQKQSKKIKMYGRIHSDICNITKFLLRSIKLQIVFTKAKPGFYLMNTATDSKATFKFLDAKRIRANPQIPLAHEAILKTNLPRYNLTRVELKTFTFSAGSQSLSIDQAVMGCIPKRPWYTMIANTDFLGTINTNPYNFQHFGLGTFAMIVNGKQIPSEFDYRSKSREINRHGIQYSIYRHLHSSFELGASDNSRYVY